MSVETVLKSIQSVMSTEAIRNEPGYEHFLKSNPEVKEYDKIIRHETIRIAVVDSVKKAVKPGNESGIPEKFRETMLRRFLLNVERVVQECELQMSSDGQSFKVWNKESPVLASHSTFRRKSRSQELLMSDVALERNIPGRDSEVASQYLKDPKKQHHFSNNCFKIQRLRSGYEKVQSLDRSIQCFWSKKCLDFWEKTQFDMSGFLTRVCARTLVHELQLDPFDLLEKRFARARHLGEWVEGPLLPKRDIVRFSVAFFHLTRVLCWKTTQFSLEYCCVIMKWITLPHVVCIERRAERRLVTCYQTHFDGSAI